MDNDMVSRQRKKDIHDIWINWYLLKNIILIGNQDGLTGVLAFEQECHGNWQGYQLFIMSSIGFLSIC
jgi:hypothetical protein